MRQISKYIMLLTAIAAPAIFSSCKKSFLDRTPPTSLPPAQALALESDLQVALRGAYAGLRSGYNSTYLADAFGRTIPVLGDIMADNAYQSLTNSNRYTLFNNYMYVATDANVLGMWTDLYTVILRCNNIINSTIASNANVNQYKGEAYAIRALCYFTLVRYFAKPYTDDPASLGVPIVLTYNPDLYPSRSKVSEVYALINADLNQAFTLMTLFTNSSQFSKYAARGLQAKVYLTMGDKTNAKTAALDVINSKVFNDLTAALYVGYWNNAQPRTDKLETLFEVSSDATVSLAFDALPNIYSQGGYGDLLASDDLYTLYGPNEVAKSIYPVGTRGGLSSVFVNKYPSTNGTDISDTKILRMSEMYLIAAEASLPANEADALTYANYITGRRNAPPIVSTGAQLFEDIITLRRKELAFEGDRYMDLQRLKRDVVRSANYPASARIILYTNFRRILPIPQSELDANPNIRGQQNPGW